MMASAVVFCHVKTLLLYLHAERPADWIEQLSSFVDLETISTVTVDNEDDVGKCLRLMPNLRSKNSSLLSL